MELHVGLSREIVAVVLRDRLDVALRERRAEEAWQGSRRDRAGNFRAWLARVGAFAIRAEEPRQTALHGIGIMNSIR